MSQDDKLKQLEAELHLQKQEIKSLQWQLDFLNEKIDKLQGTAPQIKGAQGAPSQSGVPQIGAQGAPVQSGVPHVGAHIEGQTTAHGNQAAPEHHVQSGVPTGQEAAPQPIDWEHVLGRVWLPRIFVMVLLLGVIWGFRAAVVAGYLTEPVRCILGVLAGGLFLWFGSRQLRAKRAVLGQVLLGGALAIWILTIFAAHMLYGMFSAGVAFTLNVLIVLIGIALTQKHRSQTLGILTSLAGVLVPFLLRSDAPNTHLFVSYEVISALAILVLALRHDFKILYVLNLIFFHSALLFYGIATNTDDRQPIAYGVLIHHLALLAAMIVLKSKESRFLTLFTSAAFTIGWWYALFSHDPQLGAMYTWLLLALTVIYGALTCYYHKQSDTSRFAITLTITAFALMFYALRILAGSNEAIALLLEGALLFALAFYLRARLQAIMSIAIFTLGVVETMSHMIPAVTSGRSLAWLIMIASLTAVLTFVSKLLKDREASGEEIKPEWATFKATAIAAAILLLAYLTQITDLLTNSFSTDIQHFAISAVWALYSVAAILIGTIKKSSLSRIAGMILLLVTLLKLIFFDLPTVSILIRAILFIGLGLIGLAISRVFYKKTD